MGIRPVRIQPKSHFPDLASHATRLTRPHEPDGNVGFAAAERNLLPFGRKRKADVRMIGPEVRQALDEKMRHQHWRRAERHTADERRMGGLREARDAMSSGFHVLGPLEHLPAHRREAAGSRQAFDKPNIKCGLKRGKPPADRGVIHFQITRSTGERAALRDSDEMPDVFPIDHLCEISMITRTYTEFSHRKLQPMSERAMRRRTPCQDDASE